MPLSILNVVTELLSHYNGKLKKSCSRIKHSHMSRVVRKRDFCLCENKGADQLRSNCEADQRLCFRYSDSTIPLLLIAKISSLWPASVTVQAVCVGPERKPQRPVFSCRGSFCFIQLSSHCLLLLTLSHWNTKILFGQYRHSLSSLL